MNIKIQPVMTRFGDQILVGMILVRITVDDMKLQHQICKF